eukprot:6886611-Pyramimonas_sp.AAC.1
MVALLRPLHEIAPRTTSVDLGAAPLSNKSRPRVASAPRPRVTGAGLPCPSPSPSTLYRFAARSRLKSLGRLAA